MSKAMWANRCIAAHHHHTLPSNDSDNLPAIAAADWAFPLAVAELGRYADEV